MMLESDGTQDTKISPRNLDFSATIFETAALSFREIAGSQTNISLAAADRGCMFKQKKIF
jgi:hypothetical protein